MEPEGRDAVGAARPMRRWLALSDLHGMLPGLDAWVAGVDGVLLAGDLAPDAADPGHPADQAEWFDTVFHDWVAALEIPVFACYGNHDFAAMRRVPPNLRIGGDAVADGVFLFSWSLNFGPWNWMCDETEMAARLDRHERLPDIWVMHSPPYRCCEFGPNRRHAGAKAIRRAIERHRPALVVCGHIHSGVREGRIGDTRVYNVSRVDEDYRPVFPPTLIDPGPSSARERATEGTPAPDNDQRFKDALASVHRRFGRALKRLSE